MYSPCPPHHIPLLSATSETVKEFLAMYPKAIPWEVCEAYLKVHKLWESWEAGLHRTDMDVNTAGFLWWCGFLWSNPNVRAVSQRHLSRFWDDIPY